MSDSNQIIQGILNVERSTIRISTPHGRYPVCVPSVGTGICKRCGKPVAGGSTFWMNNTPKREACEAVPVNQRWDFVEGDRHE